ncbi:MAG: PilZ domain-containing protein [Kiritimatiellia bacterium]
MKQRQEQRREPRKDPLFHLEVRNRETDELIGHIGNMSTGGFALYSKRPVTYAQDELFPLEIILPWRIYGNDRITLDAVPVWSKKDPALRLYVTGFQIRHAEPDQAQLVEKVIERMGPERRTLQPERFIFTGAESPPPASEKTH